MKALVALVIAFVAFGGFALPTTPQTFHTAWPSLTQLEAYPLDPAAWAGSYVRLWARVSGQAVDHRPQPWNGVKVMLKIETPDGIVWPQLELPEGTFAAQDFSRRIYLPTDLKALTLIVGLEQVAGTAVIEAPHLTLAGRPPEVPAADPSRPIDAGHPGRLRGAMLGPRITQADLKVLAGWGANLVRRQMIRPAKQPADLASWDAWAADEVARTDQVVSWAGDLGMKVVVDLHSPPGGSDTQGGYQGAQGGLFTQPAAQARFLSFWAELAAHYRGNPTVWGFDLANEPDDEGVVDPCLDWQSLAEAAAQAIRKVDPDRWLIVEPADWGGARGFLRFRPLSVDRVVYSFHEYSPMTFTHQGVFSPSLPVVYPGTIDGQPYDRSALSKVLDPARAFAQKYRVPMYVGEFGAIRWAPGAERWFADQIAFFEAEGWDWTYHAFREWQGWSLEEGDPARLAVVQRAFRGGTP